MNFDSLNIKIKNLAAENGSHQKQTTDLQPYR